MCVSKSDNFQLTSGLRAIVGKDRQYAGKVISTGNELLEGKERENQVLDHYPHRCGNYSGCVRTSEGKRPVYYPQMKPMTVMLLDKTCWIRPLLQVYFWRDKQTGSFCFLAYFYFFKINLRVICHTAINN